MSDAARLSCRTYELSYSGLYHRFLGASFNLFKVMEKKEMLGKGGTSSVTENVDFQWKSVFI